MTRLAAVLVLLAAAGPAAPAAAKSAPATAPALSRTAGKVLKSTLEKGPARRGRLTLADDAGHIEEFVVDAKTRTTCDGKKAAWEKAAVPGACDRAEIRYDLQTKRAAVLTLKSAKAADADDAKTRPNVAGEVAVTDVLGGKLTVRLGGGGNVEFKVVEGTKILREAEGKPAEAVGLETLKVGDRVEVRSKDWKTADEIHAAPAR